MKRDRDMDALAEALERAQDDQPSCLARLARRVLVKVAPFLAVAVSVSTLLHLAHMDLGWLLMAMFYGSPFLAVAVASFIVHAWRQNSTSPIYGVGQEVGQAEPGQVADQVGQVSQPTPVGQGIEVGQVAQVARPVPPTTVTVTVVDLPVPVAITGQPAASYYPPIPEHEEEEIA